MSISPEANVIEKLFQIQNKEGKKVDYKLNPAQNFFDSIDNCYDRRRILIAKARQKGFSSIILAKLAVRCLGKEGTHAVCMSHEAGSTQRLLDKVDFYLKYLKGASPVFGRHTRSELYFDKTESAYYIGTAGAKAFGRGDFVTDLHCSEYAWWEDPTRHFAGLFQAVPQSGRIYIESTGNGRNNDFYYLWEQADSMGYYRMFYPWYADLEYTLKLPDTMLYWKPDTPRHNAYLIGIQQKHKLSDIQMYWYEMKLREMRENIAQMQQEYPSEPEECFQATGGAVFSNMVLSSNLNWVVDSNLLGYYIYKLNTHPIKDYHYVIGADPSGGTGNDDASANVFCAETNEQVLELFNNHVNPIQFGEILCKLGVLYNNAFIVCESNNHGAAVIPYLTTNYPKGSIYKRTYGTATTPPLYGWSNTQQNKHALIGTMQDNLDELIIYGVQTIKEIKGFEEDTKGKMGGKSDNLVIATGLGILGLRKFVSYRREYINSLHPIITQEKPRPNYMSYTLDEVLEDIDKRKKSSYISQVGPGIH